MSATVQIHKELPVTAEVDVLVAGAGPAGATAALAAARTGADVMLVDRFGYPGGNMGPGMFSGGVVHLTLDYPTAMMEGFSGIPGEIIDRAQGYSDGQLGDDYFRDHQCVAYVLFKMMQENNVRLMMNTYAADPLMDGRRVTGLIVENKSGSQAVKAKVVIDATADGDIAFRAGAPMHGGETYVHPGCYFAIGDVDGAKYEEWLNTVVVPEADEKWAQEMSTTLGGARIHPLRPFYSLYRKAWHHGEYRFIKHFPGVGNATVDHGFYKVKHGIMGAQIGVRGEKIFSGDQDLMNRIEEGCRVFLFETALFMRRHVPGFENSYLHVIAPYFHTRGGRSPHCEYVLTAEDFEKGARFDDVIFRTYGHESKVVVEGGYDFPYRQLLPKTVDGLIMAGKSAIIQPPPNRTRWKCFMMGQCAGVAAALAAQDGVAPKALDIRKLQRTLRHKFHTPMGEPDRLQSLGI